MTVIISNITDRFLQCKAYSILNLGLDINSYYIVQNLWPIFNFGRLIFRHRLYKYIWPLNHILSVPTAMSIRLVSLDALSFKWFSPDPMSLFICHQTLFRFINFQPFVVFFYETTFDFVCHMWKIWESMPLFPKHLMLRLQLSYKKSITVRLFLTRPTFFCSQQSHGKLHSKNNPTKKWILFRLPGALSLSLIYIPLLMTSPFLIAANFFILI